MKRFTIEPPLIPHTIYITSALLDEDQPFTTVNFIHDLYCVPYCCKVLKFVSRTKHFCQILKFNELHTGISSCIFFVRFEVLLFLHNQAVTNWFFFNAAQGYLKYYGLFPHLYIALITLKLCIDLTSYITISDNPQLLFQSWNIVYHETLQNHFW